MINDLLHNLSIWVLGAASVGGAATLVGSSAYDVAYTLKRRTLGRQKVSKKRAVTPKISVIIYCYKQPGQTLECLSALAKSSYRKLQIIVIDNASRDGTTPAVRAFIAKKPKKDIKLISKRKSASLPDALKAALKLVRGDIVVVLDPKHIVERKALQDAAYYFSSTGAEALVPAVLVKEEPSLLNLWARFQNFSRLSRQKTLSLLSGQGSSFKFGIFYRSKLLKRKTINADGIYSSDVTLYYATTPGLAHSALDYYGLISKEVNAGFNSLMLLARVVRLMLKILVLPVFLWYSAYVALNTGYVNLLVLSWAMFTFFMAIAILAVEQLTWRAKLKYAALAPAMFSIFFVMSFVNAAELVLRPLVRFTSFQRIRFVLPVQSLKQREFPAKTR